MMLGFLVILSAFFAAITTAQQHTATVGENVTFQCTNISQQPQQTQWNYRNTGVTTVVTIATGDRTRSQRYLVTNDYSARVSTLSVYNVQLNDTGYYTCVTQVKLNTKLNTTFELTVTTSPTGVSYSASPTTSVTTRSSSVDSTVTTTQTASTVSRTALNTATFTESRNASGIASRSTAVTESPGPSSNLTIILSSSACVVSVALLVIFIVRGKINTSRGDRSPLEAKRSDCETIVTTSTGSGQNTHRYVQRDSLPEEDQYAAIEDAVPGTSSDTNEAKDAAAAADDAAVPLQQLYSPVPPVYAVIDRSQRSIKEKESSGQKSKHVFRKKKNRLTM